MSQSNPSHSEERRVIADIREKASARQTQILRVHPFRWLEAFGISDPEEIERVRARILARVREEEAKLASTREPSQRIAGFVVTAILTPNYSLSGGRDAYGYHKSAAYKKAIDLPAYYETTCSIQLITEED